MVEGTTRRVKLKGVTPIMFDRYPGQNTTVLEPHQRFYYAEDGKSLVLPSVNFQSFLGAENTH